LGPSQKTLRPTWCRKLVTGLITPTDRQDVHLWEENTITAAKVFLAVEDCKLR